VTATVLVLLLALAASGFFSGAEAALFALSESRIRTLVDEGHPGGPALAGLRARPERLLVLLRLGDTSCDVLAAALAGYLAYPWGGAGLALATAVAAFTVLLLGELLPLRFSVSRAQRVALFAAPPLLLLSRVLSPLLALVEWLARVLPEHAPPSVAGITENEVRQLQALGHTAGAMEEHEREIIERAFRLDDTKAWDIMTPRVDIFAWQDALTLAMIAPQLGTVPYSRVPVFGESVDDITGVLYVRDAYQALVTGQRDVRLGALAREPLIVPGSVSLTKLLREFQTRRIHLAIVVDEYGGTDGLVTLEDVLEELVGEIEDEMDVAEEPIVRVSRSEILAAGDADLREINHFFNISLPQLEHRSLNGYLLEELGRVPDAGETLERDGIVIEVLEASETQVIRARLRRAAPAPGADRPPPPKAVQAEQGR
jgi:CBS domain containing-hemolysin-like protein